MAGLKLKFYMYIKSSKKFSVFDSNAVTRSRYSFLPSAYFASTIVRTKQITFASKLFRINLLAETEREREKERGKGERGQIKPRHNT